MLSILILTKNSQDTIGKCLEALKGMEGEIIVVDSGSQDKTLELVRKTGAKVVQQKLTDFAEQRNIAASYAAHDWLLYIDSDEVVTPAFKDELKEKIKDNGVGYSGFFIYRKTFFLGKDWGLVDKVQRVFRKDKLIRWRGMVHETPEVDGDMGEIVSPIYHYTHREIGQMVDKTNDWSDYEAELRMKSRHPKMSTWRFFRVMVTGFMKSYLREGGWKNGTAGIVESLFQAFSMFITYAKLWEKQQKQVRS